MSELIWILAILASALQVADYWLTMRILGRGGVELNPVMAWLFDAFGVKPTLLMAKGCVAWFALSGAYFGWFNSAGGAVLLGMLIVFYGWVVAHNFKQYQGRN